MVSQKPHPKRFLDSRTLNSSAASALCLKPLPTQRSVQNHGPPPCDDPAPGHVPKSDWPSGRNSSPASGRGMFSSWLLLGTFYIFAYCSLVGNPHFGVDSLSIFSAIVLFKSRSPGFFGGCLERRLPGKNAKVRFSGFGFWMVLGWFLDIWAEDQGEKAEHGPASSQFSTKKSIACKDTRRK